MTPPRAGLATGHSGHFPGGPTYIWAGKAQSGCVCIKREFNCESEAYAFKQP